MNLGKFGFKIFEFCEVRYLHREGFWKNYMLLFKVQYPKKLEDESLFWNDIF